MSREILNSQLRVFEEPLEDNSIQEMIYRPVLPNDTTVPGLAKTRFEFIHKDVDQYINFSRGYLEIRGKVVDANGADIADGRAITIQNAFFFERCQLNCDNQLIEEVQNANHAQSILALTNMSKDYHDTAGQNMLYSRDTEVSGNDTNVGHLTRGSLTNNSAMFTAYVPLKNLFGFCRDYDKVTRGLKMGLVLHKNTDVQNLHKRHNVADGQLYFQEMKLWIPTVKPDLRSQQRLENAVSQGFVQKMNWRAINCYKSPNFAMNNINWRITTSLQKPVGIYLAFQKTVRVQRNDAGNANVNVNTNTQEYNHSTFDNCGVTELKVMVNNVSYPREPVETNFAANNLNVGRAYQNLLSSKNTFHNMDDSLLINLPEFRDIYPIHYIDLSNVEDGVYNMNSSADIEVRIKKNNAEDLRCIAVILSESEAVAHSNGTSVRLEQV